MELKIEHVHSRCVPASLASVSSALDGLWSGGPRDAFPHDFIRVWRRIPAGSSGLTVGARFGHGPFSFTVVERGERSLVARIDGGDFRGTHGFSLVPGDGGVTVTHTLRAHANLKHGIVWKALVGSVHDWAVTAVLERLENVVVHGYAAARTSTPPPASLALYSAIRRIATFHSRKRSH